MKVKWWMIKPMGMGFINGRVAMFIKGSIVRGNDMAKAYTNTPAVTLTQVLGKTANDTE